MRLHARASDPEMTKLQRFLVWWKEYGTVLMSMIAVLISGLIWFATQSGFAIIGPRDAVGQVARTVNIRVDSVSQVFTAYQQAATADRASIHRTIDSIKSDNTYTLRAVEAGNRVICFRDRHAAEVAGIICPSGKVPR